MVLTREVVMLIIAFVFFGIMLYALMVASGFFKEDDWSQDIQ